MVGCREPGRLVGQAKDPGELLFDCLVRARWRQARRWLGFAWARTHQSELGRAMSRRGGEQRADWRRHQRTIVADTVDVPSRGGVEGGNHLESPRVPSGQWPGSGCAKGVAPRGSNATPSLETPTVSGSCGRTSRLLLCRSRSPGALGVDCLVSSPLLGLATTPVQREYRCAEARSESCDSLRP